MSNMKCPFCQQEMICGGTICHYNPHCPIHDHSVPTEVLELLDRTHKELEQSEICCAEWEKQALDYKAENIALSGELKIAVNALKLFYSGQFTLQPDAYGIKRDASCSAHTTLAEITALEQKGE